MNRKVSKDYKPERWGHDPNKCVTYEFQFKKHTVTPGMKFKIKNDRTIYTFRCLVTDIVTGATWIEAMSIMGFKFLRPEKVMSLVGIKKSYRKKVAV